ncbi:MAG: hypothetical protein GEEBNDBF_01679 [bacterium]|nr:hypothetical protein [bacterium]
MSQPAEICQLELSASITKNRQFIELLLFQGPDCPLPLLPSRPGRPGHDLLFLSRCQPVLMLPGSDRAGCLQLTLCSLYGATRICHHQLQQRESADIDLPLELVISIGQDFAIGLLTEEEPVFRCPLLRQRLLVLHPRQAGLPAPEALESLQPIQSQTGVGGWHGLGPDSREQRRQGCLRSGQGGTLVYRLLQECH